MFNVKLKGANKIFHVFDAQRDTNGFTHFLMYRDNKWVWVPSEAFEPVFIDIAKLIKSQIPLVVEVQKEADKILNEEGEYNA